MAKSQIGLTALCVYRKVPGMSIVKDRDWLSPASGIVSKFASDGHAGAKVLAAVLGVDESRVYRWMYDETRGGTGGTIPSKYHRQILSEAKARKIHLTADDLIGVEIAA